MLSSWHTAKWTLVLVPLALASFALAGCGGGSPPPQDPEPYNPFTVLERFGLTTRVQTDKADYQKGEQVHIWFEVENTGTKSRRIDAYPGPNPSLDPTYYCSLYMPGSETGWHAESSEQISLVVHPGQTIRLFDQAAHTDSVTQSADYVVSVELLAVRVDGGAFDGHSDVVVDGRSTVHITVGEGGG